MNRLECEITGEVHYQFGTMYELVYHNHKYEVFPETLTLIQEYTELLRAGYCTKAEYNTVLKQRYYP